MSTIELANRRDENMVLPVLALRGLVVFPGMMLQFDVGRKKSILALQGHGRESIDFPRGAEGSRRK